MTTNEKELLEIIRTHPDPCAAVEIAVALLIQFTIKYKQMED